MAPHVEELFTISGPLGIEDYRVALCDLIFLSTATLVLSCRHLRHPGYYAMRGVSPKGTSEGRALPSELMWAGI